MLRPESSKVHPPGFPGVSTFQGSDHDGCESRVNNKDASSFVKHESATLAPEQVESDIVVDRRKIGHVQKRVVVHGHHGGDPDCGLLAGGRTVQTAEVQAGNGTDEHNEGNQAEDSKNDYFDGLSAP